MQPIVWDFLSTPPARILGDHSEETKSPNPASSWERNDMTIDPRAGQPADPSLWVDLPRLMTAYYTGQPDPALPQQRVAFGTSGHRGSSFDHSFNEEHILAISQSICDYRRERKIDGPLFLGIDTHALSASAFATTLEVLAAHEIEVRIDVREGYTPTPAISHAILTHNERGRRRTGRADGIVVSPSHNPPEDGGIKYNPPSGGPAEAEVTDWIQERANALLADGLKDVRRIPFERACRVTSTKTHDYRSAYVRSLAEVIEFEPLRGSQLAFAVDPLGGAGVHYWAAIAEEYAFDLTIVSCEVDASFRFMTVDWDGKIRMDCSSPYAMGRLLGLQERFDVAWACDTDHDRHGIVTRGAGLMNPNHYLAAAIAYLFSHRSGWPKRAAIGKTLVSSSLIDRLAQKLSRPLVEVPVGFKWFVEGLLDGQLGFAGEESAGASYLRHDGTVWTTDKDGIALGLLAAEMTAVTGRDPAELYRELTTDLGDPAYERIDAPATSGQKALLAQLSPDQIRVSHLGGEPIRARLTRAPGNDSEFGGLKIVAENSWFAVRPSGTEDVYKLYAESFRGPDHLRRVQDEARAILDTLFSTAHG